MHYAPLRVHSPPSSEAYCLLNYQRSEPPRIPGQFNLVIERRDGTWLGIEVKLGSALIDQAAAALLRLKSARVVRPPAALVVLTATEYAYQRDDGVIVAPLGLFGP